MNGRRISLKVIGFGLLMAVLISAFSTPSLAQEARLVKFNELKSALPEMFFDESYDVDDNFGGMIHLKQGTTDREGVFTRTCGVIVEENLEQGTASIEVYRDPHFVESLNKNPEISKQKIFAKMTLSGKKTLAVDNAKGILVRLRDGKSVIAIAKESESTLVVYAKSDAGSVLCRKVRKMEPAIPF